MTEDEVKCLQWKLLKAVNVSKIEYDLDSMIPAEINETILSEIRELVRMAEHQAYMRGCRDTEEKERKSKRR